MDSKKVVLVCFVFILSACATTENFNSVPVTDSEFNKPLGEINANYRDVAKFEKYWRSKPYVGDIQSLEDKWGEPDKKETNWGEWIGSTAFGAILLPIPYFLAVETLFIFPPETYYWNKGDTNIAVKIIRPADKGYKRVIRSWEWKKNTQESQEREDQ